MLEAVVYTNRKVVAELFRKTGMKSGHCSSARKGQKITEKIETKKSLSVRKALPSTSSDDSQTLSVLSNESADEIAASVNNTL